MKLAQVIFKDGAYEIQVYNGEGDFDFFIENGEPDGEWVTYRRYELHHIREGESDAYEWANFYAGEKIDTPQYVHSSMVTAIFYLMKMGYAVVGAF